MFEYLLKIRYVAVVVVVLGIAHSVMFLIMGAQLAVKTYWQVLTGRAVGGLERPGLELLHSLDLLLIGLVIMILAVGVAKLFLLPRGAAAPTKSPLPTWLNIETFSDLKILLWETILTALLIVALTTLASGIFERLDWSALALPSAIFVLALSLYFMRKH
jgi:uncharacterized membrane protein YqhA